MRLAISTWLVVASLAPFAAAAQPANDLVLMEGSGLKVTAQDVRAALALSEPEQRAKVLQDRSELASLVNELYLRRALAQQAKAKQLDRDPINATQLQLAQDASMAELALAKIDADMRMPESQVTEKARQQYNAESKAFNAPELFLVSHILIRASGDLPAAKAKAQTLLDQLRNGADFDKLARDNSDDPGSAFRGGSLGWIQLGRMVKPFEDALKKLKPGQLSEPVETQYGYHIIRVVEHRPAGKRPFDEVKTELENKIRVEAVRDARKREVEKLLNPAILKADALQTMVKSEQPATAPAAAANATPATQPAKAGAK